jgi:MinD-like ATPase involved in chromosome partitioning or flagellar assembly
MAEVHFIMFMTSLAIMLHSYRGGTGKTLLATNLAASYSKKEKVCLLDYDFSAPGLHGMFNMDTPDFWINDFLNGDCEITEVLSEVYPKLYVGLACPDSEAIRDMVGKSRSWETEALNKTVSLKATLTEQGFSKIIFDTPPGLAYSAINAVIASDIVVLVMRMESMDILGTKEMMKGVYELLEKPSVVAVNMVLPPQRKVLTPTLEKIFGKQVLGYIPCLCQVRSYIAEGKKILVDEKLDYSDAVFKLANDIENYCENQD